MTLIAKKRMLFAGFLSVATFILVSSCGNDTGSIKDETKSLTDSGRKAPAATDTTAAKPIVKKRKGNAYGALVTGKKMKVEKDRDGIYSQADQMPEYPGGQKALSKLIADHTSYPQNALDDNAGGTVTVSFIVNEDGKVLNPVVSGKLSNRSLEEEALKVVKQMPAWKPGLVKGKPVKTRLALPVTFKLEDA